MPAADFYNRRFQGTAGFPAAFFAGLAVALSLAIRAGAQTYYTNLLQIESGSNHFALQYYSNLDPSKYAPGITQILISIHGIDYDAFNYLTYGIAAAARCPGAGTNTLVIAPCLYTNAFTSPPTNSDIYWQQQPSFGSQIAYYGYPAAIDVNYSPYSALDSLSSFLLDSTNFPGLTRMVWFGFSGGGQLINRYAACSTQNLQAAARGIHTRYICGSPSSFLYMDAERPNPALPGQFYIPNLSTNPDYNIWGYGLSNLYAYPNSVGASVITNLYSQKFVIYCVGTLDTNPADPTLDTSAEAEAQGAARLDRATNYFAYMSHFYGSNISLFQAFCFVSNVGHEASNILTSDEGIKSVFDYEFTPVDTDGDGSSDWQEFLAGTNPTNALDYPKLSFGEPGHGLISVSWAAKESRRYRLRLSDASGTNWLLLTNLLATNSAAISNSFQTVSNSGFYRLQINPQ